VFSNLFMPNGLRRKLDILRMEALPDSCSGCLVIVRDRLISAGCSVIDFFRVPCGVGSKLTFFVVIPSYCCEACERSFCEISDSVER